MRYSSPPSAALRADVFLSHSVNDHHSTASNCAMTEPKISPASYISRACEETLRQHGENHLGAGYTRTEAEAQAQYALMLGVVRETAEPVHILDFGCGLAHMLDYIKSKPDLSHLRYSGLDLSEAYLTAATHRHPQADLFRLDALAVEDRLPDYDYVILNGIFNYRGQISYEEMSNYWQRLVTLAFRHARKGIAFNTMSKHVDWEREDLFHLPFDEMAQFVKKHLSRHFVIRHDYPAYEYTTYVYRTSWSQ